MLRMLIFAPSLVDGSLQTAENMIVLGAKRVFSVAVIAAAINLGITSCVKLSETLGQLVVPLHHSHQMLATFASCSRDILTLALK